MTTTTYPSQGSLDAMGRGVEKPRNTVSKAPAAAAAPSKSLFRRAWESFIRSREQAALTARARQDHRLAAELRVARDRAEWQA